MSIRGWLMVVQSLTFLLISEVGRGRPAPPSSCSLVEPSHDGCSNDLMSGYTPDKPSPFRLFISL